MKWLKMGCGHLVALPLLFVSLIGGLFFLSYFGQSSLSLGRSMMAGVVAAVTGSLGFGLLYHLWTNVWPESESTRELASEKETSRTPAPSASGSSTAPSSEAEGSDEAPVPFSIKDETAGKNRGTDGSVGAECTDASTESGEERASDDDESELSRLSDDERPWEARGAWTDAEIAAERNTRDPSSGVGRVILYSPLLMGVGGGIAWLAYYHTTEAWIVPFLIGLAFVAAGIGMVVLSGYRLLRHWRFGETTFEMDTFPGVLGGPLCGTLHTGIRAADAPDEGVRVTLSCYRRRVTQKEHGVSVHRTPLWRDEKHVEPRPAAEGEMLDVPVAFEIPSDPPASTPAKRAERIMWRIEASASLPGVDYASEVEVPIFPVEPDDSVSLDRYTRHEIEHDEDAPLSDGITLRRPAPNRLELTFGRARRPGLASLVTVLGLGFTAGAIFTLGAGGIIFGVLLLLMAVVTDWGAYHFWTYRSEVDVSPEGIEVRAGVPGFEKTTRLPCTSLTEMRLDVGNGYTMRLIHDGDAVVADGGERMKPVLEGIGVYDALGQAARTEPGEIVAARMLTDHQEAEWLASQIEEAAARVR